MEPAEAPSRGAPIAERPLLPNLGGEHHHLAGIDAHGGKPAIAQLTHDRGGTVGIEGCTDQ